MQNPDTLHDGSDRRVPRSRAGGTSVLDHLEGEPSRDVALEGLLRRPRLRAGIEQAKGIIIFRTGCDADEAFAVLTRQSQLSNRKLHDVAADLVAAARAGRH